MSATRNLFSRTAVFLIIYFMSSDAKTCCLKNSEDPFSTINLYENQEPHSKFIIRRSPIANDNAIEQSQDKPTGNEDTPQVDNPEEIPPENENHNQHAHGSHGTLGPVKHLLNTVRDRFHGNDGSGIHNILGPHHRTPPPQHESPIETEKERDMINSSTGLHVLEFLGTLFGLIWGFLSNLPAIFGSSSSGSQ